MDICYDSDIVLSVGSGITPQIQNIWILNR